MAHIIIEIQDNQLDGTVKITANPTFESMAMKHESGHMMSSAEAYALWILRKIREASKRNGRPSIPGT